MNSLSVVSSPITPHTPWQEKMEIANIEPEQSIPLSTKELKGALTTREQGRRREEWATAPRCQPSSDLSDTGVRGSSARSSCLLAFCCTRRRFPPHLRLCVWVSHPSGQPSCTLLCSHTSDHTINYSICFYAHSSLLLCLKK